MTAVFKKNYAGVYDRLYQSKHYAQEVDFIEYLFGKHLHDSNPSSILDLGCGTGGHALILGSRGYTVAGLDLSEEMLAVGRQKAEEQKLETKVSFRHANVQDFSLNQRFDAIICMFAVLGYQVSNAALFSTFLRAKEHLNPGGILIADFWYGPAVLSDPPQDRVKVLETGSNRLIRLTRPELDTENNLAAIHFDLFEIDERELVRETTEVHQMRYFFCPELKFFALQAGFAEVEFCPFLQADMPLTQHCWNACLVAKS